MADPLIERSEVIALLFNVGDIARSLSSIEELLEEDMAKKKMTKAERAEWNTHLERMRANGQRTRELAERAQAKLDAQSKPE